MTDIPFIASQIQEDMIAYRCNRKREHQRKKAVCTETKKLKENIKELLEMINDEEKLKQIYKLLKYFLIST